MTILSLSASLLLMIFTLISHAEIPRRINYQGRITALDGTSPPDGIYTMNFAIFDESEGGTSLWSSGTTSIAVEGGIFSVVLGETTPMEVTFEADCWLEIHIQGDVQSPRIRLTSAPYAFMANGLVPGTEVEGNIVAGRKAAVAGINTNTTGVTYGIYGESLSTIGYAGFFAGRVYMTGMRMPTGSGNGKVLTSNSDGSASWQTPAWLLNDTDVHLAATGNIGIGTTAPQAKLDLFGELLVGRIGNGYNVRFNGDREGSYFLWNQDKCALRSGRDLDGTHWTEDNMGRGSIATGYNTIASGSSSVAMGSESVAEGSTAIALGREALATGSYSTAIGYQVSAENSYCIAMGFQSHATESYSIAGGCGAEASGEQSVALGSHVDAEGDGATAVGSYTRAAGSKSFAAGYESDALDDAAVAMGYHATASGLYSQSMGYYTYASGIAATAFGYRARAMGDYTFAAGEYVTAGSTRNSMVLGHGSSSSSPLVNDTENSLVVGFNTTSPTFFVGGPGHRVGIGTNSPLEKLHIDGKLYISEMNGTSSGQLVRWYNNRLYYSSSSARYKDRIQSLDRDFHRILLAEPKAYIDKVSGEEHAGYIAEEIHDLGLTDLIIYRDGKPDALRYELISLYLTEVVKDLREDNLALIHRIENLERALSARTP